MTRAPEPFERPRDETAGICSFTDSLIASVCVCTLTCTFCRGLKTGEPLCKYPLQIRVRALTDSYDLTTQFIHRNNGDRFFRSLYQTTSLNSKNEFGSICSDSLNLSDGPTINA